MANSVGALIVSLGLDAAEFISGLTRSQYQAQKFARSLSDEIAVGIVKAEVALKLLGEAAAFAMRAFPELINQAGHFQDLAEKTGASAEALASFSIAAQVAGKTVDDVATFTVKLSKNLVGVDEEASKTALGLKALGIPLKEFKALDPAAQIDALAKALAKFNDVGGGKAAVLENIAKGGAELLPFLKELEESGGRQITLTEAQIRKADEFADATARSKAQMNAFAQVVAVEASGAVAALTGAVKDFVRELLGLDDAGKKLRDDNAIADFANNAVRALAFIADAADGVGRIFAITGNVLAATAAQMGALIDRDLKRYNAIQKDASDVIDGIIKRQTVRFHLEKSIAAQAAAAAIPRAADTRPGLPIPAGGRGAKDVKEKISEAQRYLESLEKQLQGTLDLSVEETALVAIYDLRAKGVEGLTAAMEAQILDYARQIDYAKELKKAAEEQKKADEEAERFRKKSANEMFRAVENAQREAASIREGTQAIEEQIAKYRGGEAAVRALTDARLADAVAAKEQEIATLLMVGASEDLIKAVGDQAQALRERQAAFKELDLAKQFAEEKKVIEDFANSISDSFANSFEGFIDGTKSAKDAFKSFIGDVQSMLVKLALKKLMNQILGMDEKGPDIFSVFAKLLGSFAGASVGGGGFPTSSSGGGFGEHFAMGTNFAPGGMAMVGEHGPEILNIPRGAQVIPNDVLRQRRAERAVNVVNNIHPPPGASTQSMRQFAAMVRDMTMRSAKER